MNAVLDHTLGVIGPHVGALALGGIIVGLLAGFFCRLTERFRNTVATIGVVFAIAVVLGAKYLQSPKVEYVEKQVKVPVVRTFEAPKVVEVEKVVKDTSESDSLRERLQAKEAEVKKLLQRLLGYEKQTDQRQVQKEPTGPAGDSGGRDDPGRIAELMERCRKVPYYEVECPAPRRIIVTRYDVNRHSYKEGNESLEPGSVLIRSSYTNEFGDEMKDDTTFHEPGVYMLSFNQVVISGRYADGRRFGKGGTPLRKFVAFSRKLPDGTLDTAELAADLNEGEIKFDSSYNTENYIDETLKKLAGRR